MARWGGGLPAYTDEYIVPPWVPLQALVPRRKDVRGLIQRRSTHSIKVIPTQPDVPWSRTQRRVLRHILQQRGRERETVPPQFNAPFVRGVIVQPRRPRGLLGRKAKPVESPPAQIILPNPFITWNPRQPNAFRGLFTRRMGHPIIVIFKGAPPHKAAVGFYQERDAIRIIPLVSDDLGATWHPRGT